MRSRKASLVDRVATWTSKVASLTPTLIMTLLLLAMPQATSVSVAGPKPEVTPTLNGDWRVYTDTAYGYSVRYPSDWSVRIAFENMGKAEHVIRRRVAFLGPDGAVVNIDVWDNRSKRDLIGWFNWHQRPFLSEEVQIPPEPNAKVAGVPAVFVIQPKHPRAPAGVSTVLQRDFTTFRIEYIASDGGLAQGVYSRMLCTFEFATTPYTVDMLPGEPLISTSGVQPSAQDCCGYHDGQYNPYPCCQGNCTWWAAYKRSDLPYQGQNWHDARNWTRRAEEEGFTVNSTPATGAVGGTPRRGYVRPYWENHVAYVESFDGSKIYFSDMDYGKWNCSVDRWYQYAWSGIEFIHGRTDCPLFEKGDANCDGCVDDLDYVHLWLSYKKDLGADFNSDGISDDLDYVILWKYYGTGCK